MLALNNKFGAVKLRIDPKGHEVSLFQRKEQNPPPPQRPRTAEQAVYETFGPVMDEIAAAWLQNLNEKQAENLVNYYLDDKDLGIADFIWLINYLDRELNIVQLCFATAKLTRDKQKFKEILAILKDSNV